MPPKRSSPHTLDLFEVTITVPTPPSDPALASAKPPELDRMSDVQLAKHLGQLVEEVQQRIEAGRGSQPELETAARQASRALRELVPSPAKHAGPLRSSNSSSALQEGQRKAVRTAFAAGVAPAQLAKHFGLSLATIRKVLQGAA